MIKRLMAVFGVGTTGRHAHVRHSAAHVVYDQPTLNVRGARVVPLADAGPLFRPYVLAHEAAR